MESKYLSFKIDKGKGTVDIYRVYLKVIPQKNKYKVELK